MSLALPLQLLIKKISRLSYSQILWKYFMIDVPGSQMTQAYVKLSQGIQVIYCRIWVRTLEMSLRKNNVAFHVNSYEPVNELEI